MNNEEIAIEPALASRMSGFEAPATIAMSMRARVLKAEGKNVISLALGQPDFLTPKIAIEGDRKSVV